MELTELIPLKEAASMLGIHYETFRRQRAMGYLRDLKIFQPGPKARPKVFKSSVFECLKRKTV